jgi:hypothetical protein
MNDDTNQVLTQAYELIESEHLVEAKALLTPILETEKDNADAWWLYAHAVQDVEAAQEALRNVVRIDPNYPGVNDLLKASETLLAPVTPSPLRPIQHIDASRVPAIPPTLPEKVDETWDFEDAGQGKQPSRRLLMPRPLAVLIPVVVIVIVGGLLVFLNSANPPTAGGAATATVEEQASIPTLPVSAFTPIPVDTIAPSGATEEATTALSPVDHTPAPTTMSSPIEQPTSASVPTGDPYEPLYGALSSFTMPRNGIEVSQTGLGETLLVSLCTLAGPELRTALPQAMTAIASVSESLSVNVEAVGARMVNCGNNSTLLVIAVPMDNAIAYANGELDEEAFQALWSSQ